MWALVSKPNTNRVLPAVMSAVKLDDALFDWNYAKHFPITTAVISSNEFRYYELIVQWIVNDFLRETMPNKRNFGAPGGGSRTAVYLGPCSQV